MPDTLLVLATLGRTFPLAQACLAAVTRESAMRADLFVALDDATDAQRDWLTDRGARVSYSPHRRGIVGAYNAGFAHFLPGLWDYLALLEDGVIVTAGWDEYLRAVLKDDPRIGWASCTQMENRAARFTAYASIMTRACAEALGGMDPVFAPEQFDDGDAIMRARRAGFTPVGTACRVFHPRSRTSQAHDADEERARIAKHKAIFAARWGHPDMPWETVPVMARPVPGIKA